MIHAKLGPLGLCAIVLGAVAMSASTAQGALLSWLVLNEAKTTATELKASLGGKIENTHLTLDGEVAGLKIALTCTGFTPAGVELVLGGKLNEVGKVIFTGCKVFKTAPLSEEYKCTVKTTKAPTGTIESNEFKGELVLIADELQARIEPKAGPTGNFSTLRFEGPECVLPELNQLHGTLYLKDGQGLQVTHKLEHLIQPGSSTALYIGGHSAKQLEVTKMLGSAWITLAGVHSGLEWSGMDPVKLSWLILNSTHTIATELKALLTATNDSTHLTLAWEIAAVKVAITCTGFTLKGVNLEIGGNLTKGGQAIFTGCKMYETAPLTKEYKCSVGGPIGTIESKEFKGELVLIANELQAKIEPIGGPEGNLAVLPFKGAECFLSDFLLELHGTLYLKDYEGFATTHKLKHLIEAGSSTALYVGGHSVKELEITKVLGSAWVGPAGAHSGLEWSGMDAPQE